METTLISIPHLSDSRDYGLTVLWPAALVKFLSVIRTLKIENVLSGTSGSKSLEFMFVHMNIYIY